MANMNNTPEAFIQAGWGSLGFTPEQADMYDGTPIPESVFVDDLFIFTDHTADELIGLQLASEHDATATLITWDDVISRMCSGL